MLAARALVRRRTPACGPPAARWLTPGPPGAGADDAQPGADRPWVLVQRDGGTTVRAAVGGGGGGVQLERSYQSSDASAGAAAPTFSLQRLRQAAVSQLQATFLPSGYPHTVAPRYLCNSLWQAAHHTAGSMNGVLASTFLLYSVGLGAGAVPTAGALNWVLKDGLGQLGTLLFGKAIAHNFDVSSRAWYLLASAKLNLAMGLEICTFLAPQYFLPMGALANAIKGLSWMAGGSTKSVFKVSFAADNNFGDVSAKATSQTICASVLGTSAGVALASQVGQSVGLALACYASLAAAHMWTGYRAVRCVPLATLNPSRLELLIQRYLAAVEAQQAAAGQPGGQQGPAEQAPRPPRQQPWCMRFPEDDRRERPGAQAREAAAQQSLQQLREEAAGAQGPAAGRVKAAAAAAATALPTPSQLAPRDPVFHVPWLHIGTPLRKLLAQHGEQLGRAVRQQEQQRHAGQPAAPPQLHLLVPDGAGGMHMLLHEDADSADCILGFLHAYLLRHNSGSSSGSGGNPGSGSSGNIGSSEASTAAGPPALAASLEEARRLLPGLLAALEAAGWDDEKVVLEPKRRRVTW